MLGGVNLVRDFGPLRALDRVTFHAAPGTVHGILGENGAGKSTLMRLLFGLDQPNSGTVTIAGSPVRLDSPRAAIAHGIGMVHQHFTLVPSMHVLDACVLAAGSGWGRIPRAAWRERIRATAARLGFTVDCDARIRDLSVGQQQRVEIIKALLAGGRALILDEPTAVLSDADSDHLLHALRRLADDGTTVLFISHKLHEVEKVCDHLTILRRGAVVHEGPCAGVDRARMAELMIGRPLESAAPARNLPTADGPDYLNIAHLSRGRLNDVSLRVRGGEIVGIAGVDGNGQTDLVEALLGPHPAVTTPGVAALDRLCGATRIGVIPDDRQRDAIAETLTIAANMALKDRHRAPWSWHGWLSARRLAMHAAPLLQRFDVRGAGPTALISSLSGGNQQKAVIARELHTNPNLIVAVNPTRGLDVAASADVMQHLVTARERGAGILLIHHDLDELLAVADRVLVLRDGQLIDSFWPVSNRVAIGQLMLGGD